MLKEDIKSRVIDMVTDFRLDSFEGLTMPRIFSFVFRDTCTLYDVYKEDGNYVVGMLHNDNVLSTDDGKSIELNSTVDNIIKVFDAVKIQLHRHEILLLSDNLIIRVYIDRNGKNVCAHEIDFATNLDPEDILGKIKDCFVFISAVNDENTYKIAYRGQYSIETTTCKFNDWVSDIKANYNDDIPYDNMNEIIRRDKAGLIMLYGEPGTGKTSVIKSLINDNRKTDFIFIDASVCDSISDGLFLEFLQDNKNAVFVFEDCEKLLESRENGVNESIGTILNLTDGLIAESMKIKFICTFNCELSKVDDALLRKGRLSLKYEFKKLCLEKAKAINPNATGPMTLADAHNANEKNDFSEKKIKKIGF